MLNKILLACCGGTVELELLARVRITVGDSGAGLIGYRSGSYGSCQVLEGSLTIERLCSTNGQVSYCYTNANHSVIEFRNETTGVTAKMNLATMDAGYYAYNGFSDLFAGVSEGQSCVISLYV